MRGQIKQVLAGLNKATVIVTHDQLEALTMADRIAVMRDGLIEQCATPHEIFARPANAFVAGFIGTPQMNLVPASLQQADGATATFRIGADSVVLAVGAAARRLSSGAQVTLGVRPRSVELAPAAAADTLAGTVDLIEPMGAETLVHVTGPERELRVVIDQHVAVSRGDVVHLRFRPGQVHLFDARDQRVAA
jgi:ABC-type sugar transport system ATPase subunit